MIYTLEEIKTVKDQIPELVDRLAQGYVKYSAGQTQVPPVGLLHFDQPEGNTYIKYGHINGDNSFVIKVFNGFPENYKQGLRTSDGLNIVFDAQTGMTKAILLDEGWLTTFRTAGANLVAARYLAPKNIKRVGVFGTGTQAHTITEFMGKTFTCKDFMVFGICKEDGEKFVKDFEGSGLNIQVAETAEQLVRNCNYIVSATNSHTPLIKGEWVQPGTHITGIGADADGKNEIAADVFAKADIVVCDSKSQCFVDGDTSFALKAGTITEDKVTELGAFIADGKCRENDDQITICDCTGIAVQDIVAAELVCDKLSSRN